MAKSATKKFVVSRKAQAVDRIGEIDLQIAALEAEREKLIAKINTVEGLIIGTEFRAKVYNKMTTWLDHTKVKRRLGVANYSKCFSSKEVAVVRVTALDNSDEE